MVDVMADLVKQGYFEDELAQVLRRPAALDPGPHRFGHHPVAKLGRQEAPHVG